MQLLDRPAAVGFDLPITEFAWSDAHVSLPFAPATASPFAPRPTEVKEEIIWRWIQLRAELLRTSPHLNLRLMGVAVTAISTPETGKPTFAPSDDVIGIGMSTHGLASLAKQELSSAEDVADQNMGKILTRM